MAHTKHFLISVTAVVAVACAVLFPSRAWAVCDTTTPNVSICLRSGSTPLYTAAEWATAWTQVDTALVGQPGVSTNTANRLVRRDANGDFATRDIDLRKILPAVGTTQFLQVGTSIDCSTGMWVQVCGSSNGSACNAAVDLTVNPQIIDGTKDGQICILLGADITNTVTLDDGNGLNLRDQRVLGLDAGEFAQPVWLRWKAASDVWEEVMPLGALDNTDNQTLDQAFDLGKLIDGANSLANAVRVGSSANRAIAIYDDATRGPTIRGICDGEPCDQGYLLGVGKAFFIQDSALATLFNVSETTKVITFSTPTRATSSFEVPTGSAPVVNAVGEIAADVDLWGAGRGAPVFFDGTSPTALVNVLVSDVPTTGQVVTHQADGTNTWETVSPAFSAVTAGTNAAALVMGTGGSLVTSGTGTITANRTPCSGTQVLLFDGTCAAASGAVATLHTFRPQQNEPPAANFATLDTRNSHPVLDFDAATAEAAVFSDILNRGYSGGNVLVDIWFSCDTNTTAGEEVVWEAQWADLTAEDLDTANPFAAIQEAAPATCSTTAGVMTKATITFTSAQVDAVIAGDPFQLKVLRQTADAADDLDTLDAEVRLIEIRQ